MGVNVLKINEGDDQMSTQGCLWAISLDMTIQSQGVALVSQAQKQCQGIQSKVASLGLSHIGQHLRDQSSNSEASVLVHNCICGFYTLQIIKIYTSVIPSNSCQIFQLFQFEKQLDEKQ